MHRWPHFDPWISMIFDSFYCFEFSLPKKIRVFSNKCTNIDLYLRHQILFFVQILQRSKKVAINMKNVKGIWSVWKDGLVSKIIMNYVNAERQRIFEFQKNISLNNLKNVLTSYMLCILFNIFLIRSHKTNYYSC